MQPRRRTRDRSRCERTQVAGGGWARARRSRFAALTLGVLWFAGASACQPPRSQRITCAGALPPDQANFSRLTALVLDPLKGCTASGCHSGDTQQAGLRLDTPNLIYDEFTARTEIVYDMLASGEMPDGGTRWEDTDLLVFRSWYCNGAFPP
jgi:hypothetical protein